MFQKRIWRKTLVMFAYLCFVDFESTHALCRALATATTQVFLYGSLARASMVCGAKHVPRHDGP